jgi:hypothetical protein
MTRRSETILNAQIDPTMRSRISVWLRSEGLLPVDAGTREEFLAGLRREPLLVLLDSAWADAEGWLAEGASGMARPAVLHCGEAEGAGEPDDTLPMPLCGPSWSVALRAWLKAARLGREEVERAVYHRELADSMGEPAVLLGPRGEVLAANREAESLAQGRGKVGMPVGAYFADDSGTLTALLSKVAWTGQAESSATERGGVAYEVRAARAGDPARPTGRMVMRWLATGRGGPAGEDGAAPPREDRLDQLERDARLATELRRAAAKGAEQSLKEADPEAFCASMAGYEELLDLSLERASYRDVPSGPLNEGIRDLAGRLGRAGAGPRDVVELHGLALRRKCTGVAGARARIYVDEGRYLIVELLGRLAGYYRARAGYGVEGADPSCPTAGA